MRFRSTYFLGLLGPISANLGNNGCEPLDEFLGNFGNQWETDCVDIHNSTGIEQPSGTACFAYCRENENEQYLYCSCNHENCFWVPNDIHMSQVTTFAQLKTAKYYTLEAKIINKKN